MRSRALHRITLAALLALTAGAAPAASSETRRAVLPGEALLPLGAGDPYDAAFRVGVSHYRSGDYARALEVWREPARAGHPGAQFSLGVAYATGNGTKQDIGRALRWWRAAAERGHAGAQFNLGLLYRQGRGVERSLAQARAWWQRAAAAGDAAAQFHLGALAATGEGEPRDYRKAATWWRRAAEQNYEPAIKGLEILRSSGVPVDAM
jgi:TPR repeat protein